MARFSRWVATIAEICMFLTSAAFLVTVDPRALVVWLAVGTLYIIGGFAAAWRGAALPQDELDEAPSIVSWTWIPRCSPQQPVQLQLSPRSSLTTRLPGAAARRLWVVHPRGVATPPSFTGTAVSGQSQTLR